MKFPLPILFAVTLCIAAGAMAESVKDREGAVRKDKAAMENDARWAYNDLERAFAESSRTGKPLLVVLRCVPCLACAGIDASILTEPDLAPLLDQFVCARVINANALDMSLFQFDYDLSFSAIVFNADKTIYGRFGSWTHQKNQHEKSTAGFRRTLERALELHKAYPANKSALAGKRGAPSPYQTPVNIPTLDGKYRLELDWQGKVVPSCVHCHQISDALRTVHRNKREPMPEELVYPMTAPETIGLTLAQDSIGRIESVAAGSIAARSGLMKGDDIISVGGQPIISVADVAWVLHRTPATGSIPIVVNRAGGTVKATLELPVDWRMKSDISRRAGTWGMRAMATGGLQLEELSDAERKAKELPTDAMALRVKHVGEYGKHAAAKRAGFLKDDVVVEVDGVTKRTSEGELIGQLLRKHPAGAVVNARVLRGGKRVELKLPMQ